MSRRLRRSLRRFYFPIVGWLAALMYVVVATGLPLPTPRAATKDRSVPFPCIDRPCGCQTAEKCWTNCCCHTPAERLAWARAHGVTPPQDLIVEVDFQHLDPHTKSCAADNRQKSCCSARPSCCTASTGDQHTSQVEVPARAAGNDVTVGIHALACQGFGTNWLAVAIALPPPPVTCEFHLAPTDQVSARSFQNSSPAFAPPDPPPRLALS